MFSEKLTYYMELRNLNNVELARLIDCDPSYISKLKSGANWNYNLVRQLATALKIDWKNLIMDTPENACIMVDVYYLKGGVMISEGKQLCAATEIVGDLPTGSLRWTHPDAGELSVDGNYILTTRITSVNDGDYVIICTPSKIYDGVIYLRGEEYLIVPTTGKSYLLPKATVDQAELHKVLLIARQP